MPSSASLLAPSPCISSINFEKTCMVLVDILGFYSTHHHAVFTHHSTNMHLHVKTRGHVLAGHLDDLTLGEGMVLQLPVVN